MRRLLLMAAIALLTSLGVTAPASAVTSGQIESYADPSMCIGIQGSAIYSGAPAVLGACVDSDTQMWHVHATTVIARRTYKQFQNNVGMCLGVTGSATYSGARVVQGTCSNTLDHSQFWFENQVGRNAVNGASILHLVNGHSGMCIGLHGSSTTGGTAVVQGTCATTPTQSWYVNF
jgi:pectate lyase